MAGNRGGPWRSSTDGLKEELDGRADTQSPLVLDGHSSLEDPFVEGQEVARIQANGVGQVSRVGRLEAKRLEFIVCRAAV